MICVSNLSNIGRKKMPQWSSHKMITEPFLFHTDTMEAALKLVRMFPFPFPQFVWTRKEVRQTALCLWTQMLWLVVHAIGKSAFMDHLKTYITLMTSSSNMLHACYLVTVMAESCMDERWLNKEGKCYACQKLAFFFPTRNTGRVTKNICKEHLQRAWALWDIARVWALWKNIWCYICALPVLLGKKKKNQSMGLKYQIYIHKIKRPKYFGINLDKLQQSNIGAYLIWSLVRGK